MTQLTPHFSLEEMACPDGTPYSEEWIEERLMPLLEAAEWIRNQCGFPLVVSSGYRTPSYNRRIGGAQYSQHMQGRAMDLYPRGSLKTLQLAAVAAREKGLVVGIGYYADFVHIDQRIGRLATWYGGRTNQENTTA